MIIDAKNTILGRLATVVAKKALEGESVFIINCEQAIISGDKKKILINQKRRFDMGPHAKGPFIPKSSDRFVKRTIRGMLPYKKPRGAEAFSRIRCYVGVPEEFEGKPAKTLKKANFSKLPTLKYLTIERICKFLGGKRWNLSMFQVKEKEPLLEQH